MCASKRKLRRQQCAGKRAYHSERLALDQAARRGLAAYRCHFCGQFHVGHRPLEQRRSEYERGKY